jgi:hypothetical protein
VAVAVEAVDSMTRPLRRAHFGVWLILAFLLPALLVAGLVARKSTTPVNPNLNGEKLK